MIFFPCKILTEFFSNLLSLCTGRRRKRNRKIMATCTLSLLLLLLKFMFVQMHACAVFIYLCINCLNTLETRTISLTHAKHDIIPKTLTFKKILKDLDFKMLLKIMPHSDND